MKPRQRLTYDLRGGPPDFMRTALVASTFARYAVDLIREPVRGETRLQHGRYAVWQRIRAGGKGAAPCGVATMYKQSACGLCYTGKMGFGAVYDEA